MATATVPTNKLTGKNTEALQAINSLRLRVQSLQSELTKLTDTYHQWQAWKRSQPKPKRLAARIAELCNIAGEPERAARFITDQKTELQVLQELEAITRNKRAKSSR